MKPELRRERLRVLVRGAAPHQVVLVTGLESQRSAQLTGSPRLLQKLNGLRESTWVGFVIGNLVELHYCVDKPRTEEVCG